VCSAVTFILLLTSILVLAFNIQRVKASGTVYIRADGSIDPPTAPIFSVDNVTYILTGNITDDACGIVVERDNIVVDGAGYTIQGSGVYGSIGIDLSGRSNVTVKNTSIKYHGWGIYLFGSFNNDISRNNVGMLNENGIMLFSSSGNSISENNITQNIPGAGIKFSDSSNNSIVGNNITYNQYGVYFSSGSSGNCISENKFSDNGLFVDGSYETFVENNTVNGKPLVYLEEVSDRTIYDAGQVVLVRCENIRIEGLNLSGIDDGIELWETCNSTIFGNNITRCKWYAIRLESSSNYNSISGNNIGEYNYFGIRLSSSLGNIISGNNITNHNTYGIELDGCLDNIISGNNVTNNFRAISVWGESPNNKIFHNNFVNNDKQVFFFTPDCAAVWDDNYPSGGNYWGDYAGTDFLIGPYQNETGSDGIGDTPYVIDATYIDQYPLTKSYSPHDIGLRLSFSKTVVAKGYNITVSIDATVLNYDMQTQTSNFSYAMPGIMLSEELTVPSRNSTNFNFQLNTGNFSYGYYYVQISVSPIQNETDLSDNNLTRYIRIVIPGDTSSVDLGVPDGTVNMTDIQYLILLFNSKPNSVNWKPNADINNDGTVNMRDIMLAILHFNQHE
jgi:parallel beta-helix repeat protein